MRKFFETLFGFVFHPIMFFIYLFAGFGFLIYMADQSDKATRELERKTVEQCYSKGLVLVQTDAGKRCADPRTLVKVK